MEQKRFDLYDCVYTGNCDDDTIYEIVTETQDHEGNYMYYIKEIDNDEAEEIGPFYPNLLVSVDETKKSKSDFPSFKSYGLTKKQVWEVAMLFMENMAELHKDLAEEAMADGNYQWATDYFKECQAFLNVKVLEDKIWHRFVEE